MDIRPFALEDSVAVSEMIRRNLTEVSAADYPESVISYMRAYFSADQLSAFSQQRSMYVAVVDQKVVGTASRDGDKIFTVFVSVDWHRQGVGRALMAKLEADALGDGFSSVELAASLGARDFYRKDGYVELRVSTSAEFGTNYVMRKTFSVGIQATDS